MFSFLSSPNGEELCRSKSRFDLAEDWKDFEQFDFNELSYKAKRTVLLKVLKTILYSSRFILSNGLFQKRIDFKRIYISNDLNLIYYDMDKETCSTYNASMDLCPYTPVVFNLLSSGYFGNFKSVDNQIFYSNYYYCKQYSKNKTLNDSLREYLKNIKSNKDIEILEYNLSKIEEAEKIKLEVKKILAYESNQI